ncbi:MAG: hypothetical protein M3340_14495 [Actinomycetota bacterium]|nr:hypothetical protein [Actinomycetota bacterium]
MSLVAHFDDGGKYRNGTDMAFWGDRLLLGNLDQGTGPNASPPGGFRIMDIANPVTGLREVGQHVCLGDQSDVSIWEDIVVLSVDKPTESHCATDAPGNQANWEGIRILSVKDPANPQLLTTIKTDCGSHTNTIYPDLARNRLIVYVLSYPLAGRYNPGPATPTCSAATHRKISVVEVPLDNPAGAKLLGTPSTGETIGCHDVTVFLERKLAGAACLTESQLWDISNPEQPKILSSIRSEEINIHHSTIFSNDGKTMVVGDELGGAAASPGCFSSQDTYGGLFFYDVSNPDNPVLKGSYKLPQQLVSEFCTAHLFNVVPRLDDKDVLVSSWYAGSTSVIDFTDPTNPTQVAYWIPPSTVTPDQQTLEAAAWSSYWYNGYVYSNNFDEDVNSVEPQSRGLDVFAVNHPLVNEGTVKLARLNPQVQEPIEKAAAPGEIPQIRLSVTPRRVRGGRRTCFRFRVTVAGKPLAGAKVGWAGKRRISDRAGRATICRRVYRPLKAGWATKRGHRPGRARVAVLPRRR